MFNVAGKKIDIAKHVVCVVFEGDGTRDKMKALDKLIAATKKSGDTRIYYRDGDWPEGKCAEPWMWAAVNFDMVLGKDDVEELYNQLRGS